MNPRTSSLLLAAMLLCCATPPPPQPAPSEPAGNARERAESRKRALCGDGSAGGRTAREEMACGDILAEDEGATAAAPHWRTAFQIATDLGERCGALWRLLGENPDAPEATSELIEQCRDRAAKKRAQGAAAELRELDRRKACEERCRDDYEQCAAFAKRSEVRSCATTETACLTGCQG